MTLDEYRTHRARAHRTEFEKKAEWIFEMQQQELREASERIYELEDEVAGARLNTRLRRLGVDPDRQPRRQRRSPRPVVTLTGADVDLLVRKTIPNR